MDSPSHFINLLTGMSLKTRKPPSALVQTGPSTKWKSPASFLTSVSARRSDLVESAAKDMEAPSIRSRLRMVFMGDGVRESVGNLHNFERFVAVAAAGVDCGDVADGGFGGEVAVSAEDLF